MPVDSVLVPPPRSRSQAEATVRGLALPDPELGLSIDPDAVVISRHCVQRYRERVESVSTRLAVRRLRDLLTQSRWRSRPLPWTQVVLHPGVVYGYPTARPDVCLLMRGDVVVTVLSRTLWRTTTGGGRSWTPPHAAPRRNAG